MSGYDDSAIGSFDFHDSMLADTQRTESFLQAIKATVTPGDVVLDIGSGTGVLSMFAAMAGARIVYAVEREPIIGIAREIADANGLSDRIEFIEASSDQVDLPELADVVVSETIGNIGLDEGIMVWAADARKRLAKPGAVFIPSQVNVRAALVDVPREFEPINRWSDRLLSLDFSALRRIVLNNVMWAEISPAAVMSEASTFIRGTVGGEALDLERADAVVRKDGVIHGLGVWFSADLAPGITISNAPPNGVPSWDQGLLPVNEAFPVTRGDVIPIELCASYDGSQWDWRVGAQQLSTRNGSLTPSEPA